MTDSTTDRGTLSRPHADLLVLAAHATHAAEMIGTCRAVLDDRYARADDKHLTKGVLYDARWLLATARESLIDRGADQRAAVAAVLDVEQLDRSADDLAAARARFLADAPDTF